MKMLLRTLAFLICAGPAYAQVTVHVTSGDSGFTDPDKGRRDSAKQVAEALRKKSNVLLVESREKALVVIQIVSREGNVLNARLVAKGFTTPFAAKPDGIKPRLLPRNGWKEAAENLADEVDLWIKQNQDKLK